MLKDSRQNEIQKIVDSLVQKGTEQGFLTFDQITYALPDSIGQINYILNRLRELGVKVSEEAPVVEKENLPNSHSNVQRDRTGSNVSKNQDPQKEIKTDESNTVLPTFDSLLKDAEHGNAYAQNKLGVIN